MILRGSLIGGLALLYCAASRIGFESHMLCRFCEQDKKLIEAHIIARCLHEPMQHPSGPMMLVTKDLNSHPKRLPTGEYDCNILCAECDNRFSDWEDYTAKLLMKPAAYEQFREAALGEDFYTISEYDYTRLKLCLLSILWRMSISTLPSFKRIALGPFEGTIRQMLLDKNPGRADEFPVFIVRLTDEVGSGTIRGTERRNRDGVNVYDLGLPGYLAVMKVDSRPTPHPIGPRVLAPKQPLMIGLKHSNYSLDAIKTEFLNKPSPRIA
jgi:hypothetical protein